jgi:hypothetical protein
MMHSECAKPQNHHTVRSTAAGFSHSRRRFRRFQFRIPQISLECPL